VYPITQRVFRGPLVSAVEAALGTAAFEAARTGGTETDLDQAVEQLCCSVSRQEQALRSRYELWGQRSQGLHLPRSMFSGSARDYTDW
jgi:hypothetical protein